MRLDSLFKGLKFKAGGAQGIVDVSSVTCDSRSVVKGALFVALNGAAENGHKYIKNAIDRGARVVVAEEDFHAPSGVLKVIVGDARLALSAIAANFYGHPSKYMKMVGITGTNGKTTITYVLESILRQAGWPAGVIGTVNYRFNDRIFPANNTTPGPIQLQSMLAGMRDGLVKCVAMEVSSHALDQRRVDGLEFDVAVFTNLTSEHLDYHKNLDEYFKAKLKIFDRLKKSGTAVINADDPKAGQALKHVKQITVTYGLRKTADVTASGIKPTLCGSSFSVSLPESKFKVETKLIGMHNVSNILASIAVSSALGIDTDSIISGIKKADRVPGRLEAIDAGQAYKIFIDYAHTEAALNNVLGILRSLAEDRIITVFGCGGNRDKSKRPLMGVAACKHSDRVIITSDNPRFEDPLMIIDEIKDGVKGGFSNYEIIPERRAAIMKALSIASGNDIVVIAGKGHENYQIIKDKTIPFDDARVAREILLGEGIYEYK